MDHIHGGQPGQPYENCACKAKKCKAYSVVIELELQRVTCPGVWLCNNGKVTIQIFLLGLCTQTSAMNPTFPLLCHEKFIFRKNFANIQNLVDIDRKLDKEIIYMELIQWEDCSNGNVLATFKTTLNDLLYPFPCYKGVVAGVDVDLLMEATRIFPGIIAPKIEVSTKLTIEEVLCSLKEENQNDVLVINPKLISSKCIPKRSVPMHQKKVCHNNKYHMLKSPASPHRSFSNKRSGLPLKSLFSNQKSCSCAEDKLCPKQINMQPTPSCSPQQTKCACHMVDSNVSCCLCKKYKNYFTNDINEPQNQEKPFDEKATMVTQYKLCKCSNIPKPKPSNSWKEPEKEKTCKCNKGNSKNKSPSRKGSKKEMTCDGDVKPICNCKAYKGCLLCEEKKTTPKLKENSGLKLPRASSTPLPTTSPMCDASCNQTFYRNLENFYKHLYLRAHHKLKNELCKCEGE